uniref:Lysyl oxidase homolog n=1 Tax=Neogobius melanostomus TaxID=47308 RepID=A0A8C6USI0_9GOBI
MAQWPLIFLYFCQALAPLTRAQAQRGDWRHRIQWENNGQVHSLMSTGSQYQPPGRYRGPSRLFMSSGGRSHLPGSHRPDQQYRPRQFAAPVQYAPVSARVSGGRHMEIPVRTGTNGFQDFRGLTPQFTPSRSNVSAAAFTDPGSVRTSGEPTLQRARSEPVARAQNQLLRTAPEALTRAQNQPSRIVLEPITSAQQPASRSVPEQLTRPQNQPFLNADTNDARNTNPVDVVNDDPRNPFKNHRNSVLYNFYPNRARPAARPPTGTGYGTRFFQNGLPDLIPDPYAIQAGTYVQRMQMYALRCAAEENCLARSAYSPTVRDIDFRVLLRFPQKVRNQGTSDFLPVKPRYQWDWHSCHQHYHSMEAFSNYDLLDAVTGRKVAEGHKASFCLEDTSCEAGFRRRYACTSHTQGLSPGCHDIYAANIDCQWVDITDVPAGNYVLKITVNPMFHVLESDFTNNIVRCDITYTGVYVQTRNCRIAR